MNSILFERESATISSNKTSQIVGNIIVDIEEAIRITKQSADINILVGNGSKLAAHDLVEMGRQNNIKFGYTIKGKMHVYEINIVHGLVEIKSMIDRVDIMNNNQEINKCSKIILKMIKDGQDIFKRQYIRIRTIQSNNINSRMKDVILIGFIKDEVRQYYTKVSYEYKGIAGLRKLLAQVWGSGEIPALINSGILQAYREIK